MSIDRLLDRLPLAVRTEILDQVVPPDVNLGVAAGSTYADLQRLTAGAQTHLLARVLRYIDPDDDEIAALARDGHLQPGTPSMARSIDVRFVSRRVDVNSQPSPGAAGTRVDVSLPLVAASTMFLTEMLVRQAAATVPVNQAVLDDDVAMASPRVVISEGSVNINLGGGLFATGIGLVVACAAGMIAAPVVGPIAGVVLATSGAVEMALDWKKKSAETAKLQEEVRTLAQNNDDTSQRQGRLLRELDIEKKKLELINEELEINRKSLELEEKKRALATPPAAPAAVPTQQPASALISFRVVQAEARGLGMSEAYAMHSAEPSASRLPRWPPALRRHLRREKER